jgi:hypothetical protein
MPPKWTIDHAQSLVTVTVRNDVTPVCGTIGEAVALLAKQKA